MDITFKKILYNSYLGYEIDSRGRHIGDVIAVHNSFNYIHTTLIFNDFEFLRLSSQNEHSCFGRFNRTPDFFDTKHKESWLYDRLDSICCSYKILSSNLKYRSLIL